MIKNKAYQCLFLLVNYYNEEEVSNFVTSQLRDIGNRVAVIIIDNSSQKSEVLAQLSKQNKGITILTANKNLGYFGAANMALEYYLQNKQTYPESTVICNTDITFDDDLFIDRLLSIESDGDIIGPDIYSTFLKYHQNPYIVNRIAARKVKSLKIATSSVLLYYCLTLIHLLKTKLVKANKQTEQCKSPINTYAVHGSFMIFKKSYFEKGGTINYPSLLFGEELFVAEQALGLGMKTIYEPSLKVNHNEHSTTGTFKSAQIIQYMHQSYVYLYNFFFANKRL